MKQAVFNRFNTLIPVSVPTRLHEPGAYSYAAACD